jgi:hypothetical protein
MGKLQKRRPCDCHSLWIWKDGLICTGRDAVERASQTVSLAQDSLEKQNMDHAVTGAPCIGEEM